MANLASVTTNFFSMASETFADNLSAGIAAGAVTVPIISLAEYTNGDVVVLTVEPGTVNEATFIGEKQGTNVINCVWTEGNTAVGHSSGATVIDYDSATHHGAQSKGILQFANQNGSLKAQPIRDALGLSAAAANGWEVFPYTYTVSSGYNQGDHRYDLTVANQDVRTILSEGMYLKMDRATAAPTQCVDLESSSSQFAQRASGSVTGAMSTVTDDVTFESWVKPESFVGDTFFFAKSSTGGTNGMRVAVDANGRIYIDGFVSAGNFKQWRSRVGIQLAVWTHIALTMDLSATASTIYINGFSVTVDLTTSGACTAFTNAGNIFLGCQAGPGSYFDGKMSDVRVWNAVRTQLQIRDNMNQQLVGSETNLIFYTKLNGDFNDSTSSANHLTGSGGAVATNVDNPMTTTQMMKIGAVSYSAPNSTVQVIALENHCVPNMVLSGAYYSDRANPYALPVQQNRLRIKSAQNAGSFNPTNASVDLADKGLVVMMTVPRACMADVTFSIGVGATSDYEYRPEIRVNGIIVWSHEPNAALTSAGGRAMNRMVRASVELPTGTNYISGGLTLSSGAGYIVAAKGATVTAAVPGSIIAR